MKHCLCPMNTDGKEERSRVGWSRKPNILIRLSSNGEPLLWVKSKNPNLVKETQHPVKETQLGQENQTSEMMRICLCFGAMDRFVSDNKEIKFQTPVFFEFSRSYLFVRIPCEVTFLSELDMNIWPMDTTQSYKFVQEVGFSWPHW